MPAKYKTIELEGDLDLFGDHSIEPQPQAYLGRQQRSIIVGLAAKHAVPASYGFRDYVALGGLFSFGTDLGDSYRRAGVYCGRIMRVVESKRVMTAGWFLNHAIEKLLLKLIFRQSKICCWKNDSN